MRIPPEISQRIEDAIAALEPKPIGHINFEGLRYHALPLYGGIGEVWLLRPDGSFWKADSDAGLALEPFPENWQLIALAAGLNRYPWLSDLLPTRPANAVDCKLCNGTGRLGLEQILFCHECKALGWRSTNDEPQS